MSGLTPTPEQRAAVEAPLAPLLVVAGAGTGKTTVMAQRILHLVGGGHVRADQILGLTFTNKAAAHLKDKVRQTLGPDAEVVVGTYHGFAASLVAAHALELGLGPATRLLNRAQAWQVLFGVFDEFRFERRKTFNPELILDDALTLAARLADHLVTVEEVEEDCRRTMAAARWKAATETAAKRAELCQVMAAYGRRKRERNLLDFGDQVALAVRLLTERPEVAAAYRAVHPVVLLDEYQDTNYAQRRLLQLLYPPGSAVTAVGDDMQSIYAFRGAHRRNILRFGEHFATGAGEVLPLQVGFRFGPQLAELANRIQAEVADALPKALEAAPGAADTTIECFLAADDAEEAAAIAEGVAAVGPPWSEHAVLCRKRRLIRGVVEALEARGVPVEAVGASGLLDRPEVVDVVAWIEVLADPGAVTPLLRILTGPRYRLGARDLAALARHSRRLEAEEAADAAAADAAGGDRLHRSVPDGDRLHRSLADAVVDHERAADLSPAARHRLAGYLAEHAELSQIARHTTPLDLVESIGLRTGLWRAAGERGRENLLRFVDLVERFTPIEGEAGLTALVEYLQLLDQSEEDLAEAHPSDADAVRVMTIHQAKGLEFDVVHVPGLAGRGASRLFPDDRASDNPLTSSSALPWWLTADPDDLPDPERCTQQAVTDALRRRRLDEEWRLLYVACTRARRTLVCSAAHWYAGASEPQGPSAFYDFVAAQADLVTERFRHEPAADDPEVAAKERRRARLATAAAAPVAADPGQLRLDELPLTPAATAARRRVPEALSVTNLVTYARCPKQFYWTVVRPLPRRSSPAARVGTQVHRWIEQRAGRQLSLLSPDEPPEPGEEGEILSGEAGLAARLQASFLASPWADLDPERVEAPFVLRAGRHLVRGRIDAVYRRAGRLELVDFKTGRPARPDDRAATLQLNLYGLAAIEGWGAEAGALRTTYCYLRPDEPPLVVSADWDAAAAGAVRDRLAATLDELAVTRFDAAPGPWCGRCDFLPACEAGRRHVATVEETRARAGPDPAADHPRPGS